MRIHHSWLARLGFAARRVPTSFVVPVILVVAGLWCLAAAPALARLVPADPPIAASDAAPTPVPATSPWLPLALVLFGPAGLITGWLGSHAQQRARERKRKCPRDGAPQADRRVDELAARLDAHETECERSAVETRRQIANVGQGVKDLGAEVSDKIANVTERLDHVLLMLAQGR